MKVYKSLSPKNIKYPFVFKETSQKIYSFEGLVFYILDHYIEGLEMLQTEEFLEWLRDVLQLEEIYEKCQEFKCQQLTEVEYVIEFLKLAPCITLAQLEKLALDLQEWEALPLQGQYKRKGDLAYAHQKYQKALKFYDKAQALLFDPLVQNNIGVVYMQLYYYDAAESAFYKALAYSQDKAITLNLIHLLKVKNKIEAALSLINGLLEQQTDSQYWQECGALYELKQEPKQALFAYKQAYDTVPQDTVLIKILVLSIRIKPFGEVCELLEKLRDKLQVHYFLLYAQLWVKENKIVEAIEVLEGGIIAYPDHPEVYLQLSRLYRQKKQIIKSIECITHAIKRRQVDDELLYEMSLIAKKAGNRKDYELKIEELLTVWKASVRLKYMG